jgi:hypothetical protein
MKNELTNSENELLDRLVREFEAKVAKSKRLADEQLLMLTLFKKALLSDSDVRKMANPFRLKILWVVAILN